MFNVWFTAFYSLDRSFWQVWFHGKTLNVPGPAFFRLVPDAFPRMGFAWESVRKIAGNGAAGERDFC
jgi:hypothetical protein